MKDWYGDKEFFKYCVKNAKRKGNAEMLMKIIGYVQKYPYSFLNKKDFIHYLTIRLKKEKFPDIYLLNKKKEVKK